LAPVYHGAITNRKALTTNRILVDLLPEQIEGLNQLKKTSKRTRAALIREAVAQYLAASSKTSSVVTPKSDAFAA
jgi:hypothetical protein